MLSFLTRRIDSGPHAAFRSAAPPPRAASRALPIRPFRVASRNSYSVANPNLHIYIHAFADPHTDSDRYFYCYSYSHANIHSIRDCYE